MAGLKKGRYTQRDFEGFFTGELALSRALKHLAQACDENGPADRWCANFDARMLIGDLLADVIADLSSAIEAQTQRVKARKAKGSDAGQA
jgi:hypothetical protein